MFGQGIIIVSFRAGGSSPVHTYKLNLVVNYIYLVSSLFHLIKIFHPDYFPPSYDKDGNLFG